MELDKVLGKVLWWSHRDGNGIIIDSNGNEYYFDRSVLAPQGRRKLDPGTLVTFTASKCGHILTAKSVLISSSKVKGKLDKKFELDRVQLTFVVG